MNEFSIQLACHATPRQTRMRAGQYNGRPHANQNARDTRDCGDMKRVTNSSLAKTSLRHKAYEELRQLILTAELPPGAAISEVRLAQAIGLSRTPVREALKQLDQEGLVKTIPQHGSFVSELTIQDIFEIYQLREQLEGFAAAGAANRMDSHQAEDLMKELLAARRAAARDKLQKAFDFDVHLHQQIVAVMRNKRLETFLAALKDQVHRIRYLSPRIHGRLDATFDEHSRIVKAILDRNPTEAELAMRQHLQRARDNAVNILMPSSISDFGSMHSLGKGPRVEK